MIDYALLCQAIADWKAGRAPSVVPPPAPRQHQHSQPQHYEADDDDVEEYEEVGEEVVEQTVIYQLPIEPVEDDDLL
ncbi:MAG: hypothetical protein KC420_17550 [Myxococcales bacterium]|nr:hypothetical protein [Myxococcales bacterium]MCB9570169.1 hypothetical protein [Myxococcales bacterium]MCB9705810.1 hypothetical protein [Myxococcales bacterium]